MPSREKCLVKRLQVLKSDCISVAGMSRHQRRVRCLIQSCRSFAEGNDCPPAPAAKSPLEPGGACCLSSSPATGRQQIKSPVITTAKNSGLSADPAANAGSLKNRIQVGST